MTNLPLSKQSPESRQRLLHRLQMVSRDVMDNQEIVLDETMALASIVGSDAGKRLELIMTIESEFETKLSSREVAQASSSSVTLGWLLDLLLQKTDEAAHGLRARLQAIASEKERQTLLEEFIYEHLAGVLDAPAIPRGKVFAEAGLKSLTAVELCSRLELGLGLGVSPTLLYSYPSVPQLAACLLNRLGLHSPAASPARLDTPLFDAVLESIENLSEEEAARLLAEDSERNRESHE